MKTFDYFKFWAIFCLVCVPVLLGLMTDKISYGIFAIAWAAMWWAIFTRTDCGKKAFRKGYRIASNIMGDCDV